MSEDDFLFAEDTDEEEFHALENWKILVVDDEPEVHAVTKLALSDFVFQEKGLEFISAYSGAEAKQKLREHEDIAIVLLDVVMETDDAGLKVADFIRHELHNNFTRIILRTGQPGQAPEKDVILNYDINDYKSKTELTAQKLFTVTIATLRSYRDIVVIEENRKGLEKIIASSADLFTLQSLESFIEGIIQQLASLLGGTKDAVYITSAVAGPQPINKADPYPLIVFKGKGEYSDLEGKALEDVVSGRQLESCRQAMKSKGIIYEDEYLVAYCASKSERGSLLYLSGLPRRLTGTDKRLIEIFSQNVQIAFDNILLNKDIEDTQRELLERIGNALQTQLSKGKNIKRMDKLCHLLGSAYGLGRYDLELLKLALPLHDIGKLGLPDAILEKPGELSADEKCNVKSHADLGYKLLKGSNRPILQTAALIARDHHEHWDGNGYPRGLKGEAIHINARIIGLVDVFDALISRRHHKDAWPLEKVMQSIVANKGKQFDPVLVDILQANLNKVTEIVSATDDDASPLVDW